MGGEPGVYTVRFAPSQQLPAGYDVVFDGHLFWWQNSQSDYGGGDVNRWIVRRLAIEHAKQKQQN